MIKIKTVTVIGATGTMGANVAGIFASFGNAQVYCVGRDIEKVRKTIPRIVRSVKADAISRNLIPADYSMLEECIKKSDLVFESVAEDMNVKREIAEIVGKNLNEGAIACTGTSGLSVSRIALCFPDYLRGHFFGVHMFNPPYSLSLCELIPTQFSNVQIKRELKIYLENVLMRTVVEVKDSPAFLGNRIGFQFINESLQYAYDYRDNGGIDYIDAILGPFTGRSMSPINTSNFVGLDVHKAIVDNLYDSINDYAHDTFILPEYVEKVISNGTLGVKSGAGLYKVIKYDNGFKRMTVLDINTGIYRDVIPYVFPFAEEMKRFLAEGDYYNAFASLVYNQSQEAVICRHFLLGYIVYSLFCAKEVAGTIGAADDVMATGFNWCPPLAMYKAFSLVADVKELIRNNLPDVYNEVNIEELLNGIENSKYDFRSYFKSGR